MIFECKSCGIKLRFDESKYNTDVLNIKCPRCKDPNKIDLIKKDSNVSEAKSLKDNTAQTQEKENMSDINTIHHLFAIRLNWLKWLAKPLLAVWNFIVDSLKYIWEIILLSWSGTKDSLNYRYWIISAAAASTAFFISGIFNYITIVSEIKYFSMAGYGFSILIFAWLIAVIADIRNSTEKSGKDINLNEIPARVIRGLNIIMVLCVYLGIIITAGGIQALLLQTARIPQAGPLLINILLIPVLICSALMIISGILLIFGTPFLGAHLVKSTPAGQNLIARFRDVTSKLIKIITGRWTDLLVAVLPAVLFSTILTLLPLILILGSFGLSQNIIDRVSDASLFPTFFTITVLPETPVEYITAFFSLLSFSIIFGIAASLAWSGLSVIYYKLYSYQPEAGLPKKIFAVLVVLIAGSFIIKLPFVKSIAEALSITV